MLKNANAKLQTSNSKPADRGNGNGVEVRAMVVTNRYFTSAARSLARANGVELWDRDRLVSALLASG